MNSYVLTFAIGPVQGFIASARRSRDLWAGSWLLSELAKVVARNLHENGAELIFPFVGKNTDLLKENSEFSVGNKIQVIVNVESREKLIKIADNAKAAAKEHFEKIANQVWQDLGNHTNGLRQKIWENQKNDYVEVQYAWAHFNSENEYSTASQKAAQLLAARKATRDFTQQIGDFLPKSSLDGARETVLLEEKNISRTLRNKLGLSQSEQLDCVGVVKRLCGTPEQFTSITRMAAHDWLKEIPPEQLEELKTAYEPLVGLGLATRVRGNKGIYDDFPYDAQFCYSSSLNVALLKADENEKKALNHLQDVLKGIKKGIKKEPCPYFAMLLADGDRMGELLDKAKTKENHQAITQNLSAFAQSVPQIMRDNQAQCIYSGGDDVLGLVSLSHAVKCAETLKDNFSSSLKNIANELGAENPPTLSVGLAICHIQNPLGNIRALAKRAEKVAKGDNTTQPRNALGITLAVRSGAVSDMRLRWDDIVALNAFDYWIMAYQNGDLSSRVAYDCRDIFTRTDFSIQTDDVNLLNKIRAAEFKRMLLKAHDRRGKDLKSELITLLENRLKRIGGLDVENGQDWINANDSLAREQQKTADLDKLATELIIARWLAAKTQNDLGRENG